MIARHWRGVAKADRAEDYALHLRSETFPALRGLAGFVDAAIHRRTLPAGVEFVVVTRWASIESIRAFAGADVETAVVPAKVREMMVECDATARHYEVLECA